MTFILSTAQMVAILNRGALPGVRDDPAYATPSRVAVPAVDLFMPSDSDLISRPIPFRFLDPCCGESEAFLRAAARRPNVEALWCEINRGRCFYSCNELVDLICGNPPWSTPHIRWFLHTACRLSREVVFLARVGDTIGCTKTTDIPRRYGHELKQLILLDWPPEWPHWGFQLGLFHWSYGHTGTTTCSSA